MFDLDCLLSWVPTFFFYIDSIAGPVLGRTRNICDIQALGSFMAALVLIILWPLLHHLREVVTHGMLIFVSLLIICVLLFAEMLLPPFAKLE